MDTATPPDPARLAEIHAASFEHPRPWTRAEIEGLLDSPHCFLLAESQGFLIGRTVLDEAELLTLAVAPDARRSGIGARLVTDFLAHSAARGAASAFLEVAADNEPALGLYLRSGFARTGLRRGYYVTAGGAPVDAVLMARPTRISTAPET